MAGPLFADAAVAAGSTGSLWRRLTRAVDETLLPTRAVTTLRRFRDLILTLSDIAGREPVSDVLGKLLDQSGYLEDLRERHTEEAEGRLANLMELVSAARDYEMRDPEPSLSGFVDRLSLLSETDEEKGAPEARIWLMTLHAAKGLEFPVVFMVGMEEGLFPHVRAAGRRGRARGGATAVLRRDDPRADTSHLDQRRPAPGCLVSTKRLTRRGFSRRSPVRCSRWSTRCSRRRRPTRRPLGGRGAAGVGTHRRPMPMTRSSRTTGTTTRTRTSPSSAFAPAPACATPTFGVGTILTVEPLTGDMKLTVRFTDIGRKTIRAKYAKLTLA